VYNYCEDGDFMTKKKILKTVLIVFLIVNVFVAIISFGIFGSFNIYRVIGGMISVSNDTEKIVKVSIVPKVYMMSDNLADYEVYKKLGFHDVYYDYGRAVSDGKNVYKFKQFRRYGYKFYTLNKLSEVEYKKASTLNEVEISPDIEIDITTDDIKKNKSDLEYTVKNNTNGTIYEYNKWIIEIYEEGEWRMASPTDFAAMMSQPLEKGEEVSISFNLDIVPELRKGKYRLILHCLKTVDEVYYTDIYGAYEFEIE